MSLGTFTRLYLDYVNNFLTVECFAEHYEISIEKAAYLIMLGREINNMTLETSQ